MSGPRADRRTGVWTLVFALILIVVGSYYVFRNTLGLALPELHDEQVVPIIVLVFGLVLLYRSLEDRARIPR
jgi:uncharacterized membrane protein YfcA